MEASSVDWLQSAAPRFCVLEQIHSDEGRGYLEQSWFWVGFYSPNLTLFNWDCEAILRTYWLIILQEKRIKII